MKQSILLCMLLLSVATGPLPVVLAPDRCCVAQSPPAGAKNIHALTNSIGMKLVQIPTGKFLMGSADSEKDAQPDEKPQHQVQITRPFFMGAFEVTQAEYEKVMGANPSFFSTTGPGKSKVAGLDTRRLPVEQV